MTDLSDVNMEGVKPMGEQQDLPIGKYLVRIEDTEKKATKDKFDTEGRKLAPNHYLQIAVKVYGGPNDEHTEFLRLNLWNANETAVNIARSEFKSIQDATGVASPNSDHYHGKWMILEVKANSRDASKTYRSYLAAPVEMVAAYAHIPPVPMKAPSMAATQPSQAANAPEVATQASSNALPSWATK